MPRSLTRADRNRVVKALREWCSTGLIVALRTRALVMLAMDTGLRVSECVKLDLRQLLVDPDARAVRLQESFYLRPKQAKGGERGAGTIAVSERARSAVREYILAIRGEQWVKWPPADGTPLFLGHRGHRGRPGHGRLSVRAAQYNWHETQRRARLGTRYGFHALRHDAASRLRAAGADLFDLATQMRWSDLSHAQRYVHELDATQRLPSLAKKAAKL